MKFLSARYARPLLWTLISCGLFSRLWTAYTWHPLLHVWSDPARHWENALNPVTHNPVNGIDPLFYQTWLMIIAKLTNGDALAIRLYAGLLSALTPWIWYRFMRELFQTSPPLPPKTACAPDSPTLGRSEHQPLALWGFAVFAWLPSWIGIYSYFMMETVLLPLIGLALWMTWRALRKNDYESFVWMVLVWSTAVMTKYMAAPLAFVSLVWVWTLQEDKMRRGVFALSVFAAIFIISGYRTRNVIGVANPLGYSPQTKIYMDSGKAGIAFTLYRKGNALGSWVFGSPSMKSHPFSPLSNWESHREGTLNFSIDLAHGTADWNRVLAEQKLSISDWARYRLENIVFLLWGYSWPDDNPDHFWEWCSNQLRWVWAPLLVLIFSGNIRQFRREHIYHLLPALTMSAWIILLFASIAPTEGRYRKAYEGLLIANAFWLLKVKQGE